LVGDIIDGWSLSRKIYWPQMHNDVVQKLLRKVRKGTRMVWVIGNHDEFLRPYNGSRFGDIEIVEESVHTTVDGRRFLVVHGDKFDNITQHYRWLAVLGDISYETMLVINRWIMYFQRRLGLDHWSLSAYVKRRVKQAACFISRYEQTIAAECQHRVFHGIICGHIHHAEIKQIDDVVYCNTGDWVESCTALVENFDGNFILLHNR
jgi:UDP-2,3-diacylglucosamine pyrophosphatase LpxH